MNPLCPDGSFYSYGLPIELQILLIILPLIIAGLFVLIMWSRMRIYCFETKELRRLYETYSLCRTVCRNRGGCKLCIIDDIAEILGEERRE